MKLQSIKAKIIIPILLVILIESIFLIYREYNTTVHDIKRNIRIIGNNKEIALQNEIESYYKIGNMFLNNLLSDIDFIIYFYMRDENLVRENIRFRYQYEKDSLNMELLQLYYPDNRTFLRINKLENPNQLRVRRIVRDTNNTLKDNYGLGIGEDGLKIRVTKAVKNMGEHIGCIEYGAGINSTFLNQFIENSSDLIKEYGLDIKMFSRDLNGKVQFLASNTDVDVSLEDEVALNKMELDEKPIFKNNNGIISAYYPIYSFSDTVVGAKKYQFDVSGLIFEKQKSLIISIAIYIITTLIIMLIIAYVVNTIISKLEDFINQFAKAADGDFSEKIKKMPNDEIGNLAKGYNKMGDKLRDVFKQIKTGSFDIMENLDSVNEGNKEISERTSSQAAAIEETSTSLQEINWIVKKYKEESQKANELTKETKEKAESIGVQSVNLYEAMLEITESSQKISKILEVIEEISVQTNLLAINASVEATKAGQEGKGFAVVASEIRNLARKSSESAKEIRQLIKESDSRIEEGNRNVNDTLLGINGIVNKINKIDNVIRDIAQSAEEQSVGMNQIQSAVHEIENVTQYQVERTETLYETTDVLYSEVTKFLELIDYFKIDVDSKEKVDELLELEKSIMAEIEKLEENSENEVIDETFISLEQ